MLLETKKTLISYEEIWNFLKKDNNWQTISNSYKELTDSYGFGNPDLKTPVENYKYGTPTETDNKLITLWTKIFTKYKTLNDIEKSNEKIQLEQWLFDKKSKTPYWYVGHFYKSSFGSKWYSEEKWKDYTVVKYKNVKLSSLVICWFENFLEDLEFKRVESLSDNKMSRILNNWKLLGDLFIWDDRNMKKYK